MAEFCNKKTSPNPLFGKSARDPVLEEIRRNVEGPPDLTDTVAELEDKTRRIHAAFLFDRIGEPVLQELCILIGSTKSSLRSPGWEEFCVRLGIAPIFIKLIECSNFNDGPTFNTLLKFVQSDNATLDKVIHALYEMKRYDIILKTKDIITDLADKVLNDVGYSDNQFLESSMYSEESGYHSNFDGQSDVMCGDEMSRYNIIKPPNKPLAPYTFQELSSRFSYKNCTKDLSPVEKDPNQTAVPEKKKSKSRKQCGRIVLLTFASDGRDCALKVAAKFREERKDLPRIGVVVLEEHAMSVNSSPEQFITGVFSQVDYVVPIITEEYLKTVASRNPVLESLIQCFDAKYIKHIYSLMSTDYMRNGCINKKVRCIVPDNKVYLIHRHPLMAAPIFQVWVRANETEELSRRILRSRF